MNTSKRPLEDSLFSPSSSLSPSKKSRTEPSTPPPKDLSGLFSHVTPISVVSTPSKSLTRRMLAKSKTESAIMVSPSKKAHAVTGHERQLGHSLSLPAISSSPVRPGSTPPPSLSPSPSSSRVKANVRTYAQVRSFLIPLSLKNTRGDTENNEEVNSDSKESYSTLRNRLGVDHSEDNPFHVSGQNNDLSTITELRSKGEARRFLDEMGYLFEGLEPGMAPSVLRSSAYEIIVNMCDSQFMRKAKATDFTNLVWDAMVTDQPDSVLDFYVASFIALVARDRRDIENLSQKPGFFEVVKKLLQYPKERDAMLATGTRLLKSIFKKSEIIALTNLRQTIMKSGIFPPHSSFSLWSLVLYPLRQISISAIPDDLLSLTYRQLLDELNRLQTDISVYMSEQEMFTCTAELQYIRQCLSLLDSTLIGGRIDGHLQESLNTTQELLISRLAVLYGATQCTDARFFTLHGCIEDILRVLISLSNLDSSWATLIGQEPMLIRRIIYEISTDTKLDSSLADSQVFSHGFADKQCLALALLSNLVLTGGKVKDFLCEIRMNRYCFSRVGCILECECELQTSPLNILTSLFVELRVKSESHSLLFFRDHVAALLCLLTINHPINRKLVAGDLKKENALLGPHGLKESIQSFQRYYAESNIDDSDISGPVGIQMQEQIKEACRFLCSY